MWSCDSCPIGLVLNGAYPEAAVKRMGLSGLERLVAGLVQRTADAASKPQWWPSGVVFNLPDLDELALKKLVADCSQFFKEREWNDENRGIRKRKKKKTPTKNQFLQYFKLDAKLAKTEVAPPPPVPLTAKLTSCIHIPFSSDVGRIMAAKEHHHMSDDLKIKRLERSEWYINKDAPRLAEVNYEQTPYKEPTHYHNYKIPKRQFHQKRHSWHDPDFLLQFCNPLVVNLQRLDLDKVKKNSGGKELVVLIGTSEKLCCDVRNKPKRTSPRLRNL